MFLCCKIIIQLEIFMHRCNKIIT